MARVEEWLPEFMRRHTARCHRHDWPTDEDPDRPSENTRDFYDAWRHAFVTHGVEDRFADLASLEMAASPPAFLSEHLPMVLKLAAEYRRRHESGLGVNAEAASVEAATSLSRDCPDCGGTGGALRYVHQDILGKVKTFGGHPAPLGYSVAYPCSCPLGKFVARGLRQPGQAADPLTIDQYPSLRLRPVRWSDRPDCKYRYRPSEWDDDAEMPAHAGEVVTREEALGNLKALYATESPRRGRGGPGHAPHLGRSQGDPSAATESGSGWLPPVEDPVIGRERATATPPEPPPIHVPEDAPDPWF